jgi:hypothetical protein
MKFICLQFSITCSHEKSSQKFKERRTHSSPVRRNVHVKSTNRIQKQYCKRIEKAKQNDTSLANKELHKKNRKETLCSGLLGISCRINETS